MKLPSSLSHLLIGLTENNLITGNRKHTLYYFFLQGSASFDVNKCNEILVQQGFKELVVDRYELKSK